MAKRVAGGEAVVGALVDVGYGSPAVPSAHIFAGSGDTGALAKGLEKAVLIEGGVSSVVGIELVAQGAIEEFDVSVVEPCEGLGGRGGK